MKKLLVGAVALMLTACSQGATETASKSAVGDWTVDAAQSRVAFSTVKSGEMGESHQFKTVSGGVSADGAAKIAIDLSSIDTKNPIRDQRMKDVLFHVADHPEAVVTATLNPADFETLAVAERRTVPVTLNVDLHGVQSEVDAELFVTRVGEDKVLVETVEPIQIFAQDFNLMDGLAELQKLASLPSIAPVAPVTFSLLLTR